MNEHDHLLRRMYQAAADGNRLVAEALKYIAELEHRNAALMTFANGLLRDDGVQLIPNGGAR